MSDPGSFFKSLIGFAYDFYGVDDTMFCIGLEGKRCVFEAIEDPSDGYRSYLESVQVSIDDSRNRIFFRDSLGKVMIEETTGSELKGYSFKDVDTGHVWLQFGTDEFDNYYPLFTFRYRARAPDAVKLSTGGCSCCRVENKHLEEDNGYLQEM